MPTLLAIGLVRTQLKSPDDLDRVKEIQAGFSSKVIPGKSSSSTNDSGNNNNQREWIPISDEAINSSEFWTIASFLLPFAPAWPGDEVIRNTFPELGIVPGSPWPTPSSLPKPTTDLMFETATKTGIETVRYLDRAAAAFGGMVIR